MDRHRFNATAVARALRAPAGGSSDFDLNPEFRPQPPALLRPASVLVPLIERGAGLNLILTRRAARLKHHPGQVAFPGGKQDAADPDARSPPRCARRTRRSAWSPARSRCSAGSTRTRR